MHVKTDASPTEVLFEKYLYVSKQINATKINQKQTLTITLTAQRMQNISESIKLMANRLAIKTLHYIKF